MGYVVYRRSGWGGDCRKMENVFRQFFPLENIMAGCFHAVLTLSERFAFNDIEIVIFFDRHRNEFDIRQTVDWFFEYLMLVSRGFECQQTQC